MKKKKYFLGLVVCFMFASFGGTLSETSSAKAGYYVARRVSQEMQAFNSGAGGTLGGLIGGRAGVWAGTKLGGEIGGIVGGPIGAVVGAGLGAL